MLLHHWISTSKGNFHQLQRLTKCLWHIINGGVYRPALKPVQSALVGMEWRWLWTTLQTASVVYLTVKKLIEMIFVGSEKTLPKFNQHFPAKCSVFPLLFSAEHYQSLEIALTNVSYHHLKVDLFHIEFCNDVVFW
jgi:hypothetical protein